VAWAGFLRSGEFIYSLKDQTGSHDFINTKLTRSDITFDERYEYAILRLKRSKTDTDHKGIEIIFAATHTQICPVSALRRLFLIDKQPSTAPLFRSSSGAFDYEFFVNTLRAYLLKIDDPRPSRYSGHGFRRGAAQPPQGLFFSYHTSWPSFTGALNRCRRQRRPGTDNVASRSPHLSGGSCASNTYLIVTPSHFLSSLRSHR
jgi:hypothetical protein